jgi:NADH-quinone oxidoreductase subunit E
MSLSEPLKAAIVQVIDHHGGPRPAMLESLRMIHQELGWVNDAHLAEAADILGVTRAEIDDIATFYSLIFRQQVGRKLILLCDRASCYRNRGEDMRDRLMDRLGIGYGETTPDGEYTLINICCIGACDKAPAAVIGRDCTLMGPLSPDDLDALLGDNAI